MIIPLSNRKKYNEFSIPYILVRNNIALSRLEKEFEMSYSSLCKVHLDILREKRLKQGHIIPTKQEAKEYNQEYNRLIQIGKKVVGDDFADKMYKCWLDIILKYESTGWPKDLLTEKRNCVCELYKEICIRHLSLEGAHPIANEVPDVVANTITDLCVYSHFDVSNVYKMNLIRNKQQGKKMANILLQDPFIIKNSPYYDILIYLYNNRLASPVNNVAELSKYFNELNIQSYTTESSMFPVPSGDKYVELMDSLKPYPKIWQSMAIILDEHIKKYNEHLFRVVESKKYFFGLALSNGKRPHSEWFFGWHLKYE